MKKNDINIDELRNKLNQPQGFSKDKIVDQYNQIEASSTIGGMLTNMELEHEQLLRKARSLFPLELLPKELAPFISELAIGKGCDRNFIGSAIVSAAAAAIGSSIVVEVDGQDLPLSTWQCLIGKSSSGKSLVSSYCFAPLKKIENNLITKSEVSEADDFGNKQANYKSLFLGDSTFEALTQDFFRQNFKGVVVYEDELLLWLQAMAKEKSAKAVETFWLSSWNAAGPYSRRRTNKLPIVIKQEHLVANVFGTTQSDLVHEFFLNNRAVSGFSFRFLFTLPVVDQQIAYQIGHQMNQDIRAYYNDTITFLYNTFPMDHFGSQPMKIYISPQAAEYHYNTIKRINKSVVAIKSQIENNISGGFYGKFSQYAIKFAAILKALRLACIRRPVNYKSDPFDERQIELSVDEMADGCRLAEYYFNNGWATYQIGAKKMNIPKEVTAFAVLMKKYDYNQSKLGEYMGISRQRVSQLYKQYSEEYPSAFQLDIRRK
jgi:hypothetical protein